MSHEPSTINNRLIHEVFDYILLVLDVPKQSFHVFRNILVHIQDFEIVLDGSSSFVGARLFGNANKLQFHNFEIYTHNIKK